MKVLLTTLLTFLLTFPAYTQTVYGLKFDGSSTSLAEIDLQTGVTSTTIPIPGANYSVYGSLTFDDKSSSYIFWGADFNNVTRFYSVQVDGLGIINPPIPPLPLSGTQGPVGVEFDLSTGLAYGILNSNSGQLGFVSVNLLTGQINLLNTFTNFIGPVNLASTFDSNHHHYIFQGQDNTGANFIYFLDALTGQLIKQIPVLTPQVADNRVYAHFEWDNNVDQLFGVYGILDPNSAPNYTGDAFICVIDTGNGGITNLTANPVYTGGSGMVLFTNAMEQNTREYLFATLEAGGNYRLKVFNLDSMAFTIDIPYDEDVKQLQIDNSAFASRVYGLELTTDLEEVSSAIFSVYPQPAHDFLRIRRTQNFDIDEIRIIDVAGRLVQSRSVHGNELEWSLDIQETSPGLYGVLLMQEGKLVQSNKFLKQ